MCPGQFALANNLPALELHATNPLAADTIKTRLQFQGPTLRHVTRYDNFFHAFRTILRDEGPRGFARGLPARLTYVTPAAGTCRTRVLLDCTDARQASHSCATSG